MNKNYLPRYFQISEYLRQKIESGDLTVNQQIPTEELLCEQFAVSRGTVREALRVLEDEGLIRRERGRGSFVQDRTHSNQPALFSLVSFEDMLAGQNRPLEIRLLTAEIIPATDTIVARLAIPVNAPTIHVERLFLVENRPVLHERRYLAQTLCPDLLTDNLAQDSLHRLLIQKYKIPLVKFSHTVEIGRLSPEQVQILDTATSVEAFFIDRLTYTMQEKSTIPAVWYQAICLETRYRLNATRHSL